MKKLCVFLIAFVMPLSAPAHDTESNQHWTTTFEVLNESGGQVWIRCGNGTYGLSKGPGRHCLTCPSHQIWYTPFATGSQEWGVHARDTNPDCHAPDELRVKLRCDGSYCITVSASQACLEEDFGQC